MFTNKKMRFEKIVSVFLVFLVGLSMFILAPKACATSKVEQGARVQLVETLDNTDIDRIQNVDRVFGDDKRVDFVLLWYMGNLLAGSSVHKGQQPVPNTGTKFAFSMLVVAAASAGLVMVVTRRRMKKDGFFDEEESGDESDE